jgi:protein O-mannosyl-transferase
VGLIGRILQDRRAAADSGVAILVIGALAVLVYGPHLRNPLVFDSAIWFSEDNLRALRDATGIDRIVSKTLTVRLHDLLGGRMDLFRAVHLALHAITAYALFALVRRVVPLVRAGPAPSSFAIALGTAVLFTLHPVQVYAVADPGQMELVLATLFGISMLRAYLEALVRSSRLLFFLSVALFVLAVLSKENVIAMPAVAAVLTALVRRPSWAVIRALWPWYCLYGLIVAGVVIAEIDQPRDAPGRAAADAVAAGDVSGEALRTRSAITQANQFFRYLTLWLVPHVGWMAIDLQHPLASRLSAWPESAGAVAFCLYPVAAGWLLMMGGRAALVGFGLLWSWLLFLPELAATRITEAFVLYRSYPWIPGFLTALVSAATPLLGRAAAPLLCVLCLGLGGLAYERLATFRSAHAVWDDAVQKNRWAERRAIGAYRAYLNRGRALMDLDRVDAALHDFAVALELRPGLPYAHFNRGIALVRLRQYPEALAAFDEGFRSSERMPPVPRARAYSNRAGLYLLLGRREDALADLVQAAALDPARAEYRLNLERLRAEIRSTSGR